jgi:hypothetical protein
MVGRSASRPDLAPRVQELLAQAYALTLGDVAIKLEGVLPPELRIELRKAVDAGNFLGHHFWFDRAHPMFDVGSVHDLIAEVDGHRQQFDQLDILVSQWKEPHMRELGITEELINDCERRILAGETGEPLPDKEMVKDLQTKLCKQQRLARVWSATTAQVRTSLIFELIDGTLRELSDVGLVGAETQKVGPVRIEHPDPQPHLPSDTLPRPKAPGPWDYEFALAKGATLWIKPGRRAQSFRWGVHVPEAKPK